jgi:DNA-binding CsgD family transcriptional regulator
MSSHSVLRGWFVQYLPIQDVESIARLLAEAGDPTVEISVPNRKRMLVEGVAKLVDADVWVWIVSAVNPTIRGSAMPVNLMDDGWKSDEERSAFYLMLMDPGVGYSLQEASTDVARTEQYRSFLRPDLVPDEKWNRLGKTWQSLGFDPFIMSVYPLGNMYLSGIGLHRRIGRPPFTLRDRAISHVVFQQVDWLHRFGSDVPAGEKAFELSPRERQVMMLLIGGDSLKEIASKMKLSHHTIDSYVKRIYKHFEVHSRAELLAHFISGGKPA